MNNQMRSETQEPSLTTAENETATANHGIKKRYLLGRNACAVTFRLSAADAAGATHIALVGDFNDWNACAHPMRKKENGDYSRCLRLEAGRQYQYRYIVDGVPAANVTTTEKPVKCPYSDCKNSVVAV